MESKKHLRRLRISIDELSLRTQVRSSLGRPQRRRKYARIAHDVIELMLSEEHVQPSGIMINYDPQHNPPAYGEFLTVCMLQRFLTGVGRSSTLIVPPEAEGWGLWNTMDPGSRRVLLEDFRGLGTDICLEGSRVTTGGVRRETGRQINPFPRSGIPLYMLAPTLLTMLFSHLQDDTAPGLLLDSVWESSELKAKTPQQPYVTWNVRAGDWDSVRDLSERHIVSDFLELREMFPKHNIMILSNSVGARKVLQAIHSSPRLGRRDIRRIVRQPEPGYRAAAYFLLRSSGHFQRRGGGIAMVATFSRIPYVIIDDHRSNFLDSSGTKLVPWASAEQIYKISRGCRSRYQDYAINLL